MMRNGLTNNQLKLIALIAMTCDHVGKLLAPQWTFLQVIGRLAYPVFTFMIAQGCIHTGHPRRYLLTMAGLALFCQVIYFAADRSLYQCILVTFTLSIALIFVTGRAIADWSVRTVVPMAAVYAAVGFVCCVLPDFLPGFWVDYGFLGVLTPLVIYLCRGKRRQLTALSAMLLLLGMTMQGIQWFALAAVPLLALYNGRRGVMNMKRFFYLYYPLHLAVIYLADMML